VLMKSFGAGARFCGRYLIATISPTACAVTTTANATACRDARLLTLPRTRPLYFET
jgi:hypothetical protein